MGHLNLGNILFMFHHIHGTFKFREFGAAASKYPQHNANMLHAYPNLDWATCVKTRCSFGGAVIQLAGGTITYKLKFQPTDAGSSTEVKFMAAYNTGKIIFCSQCVVEHGNFAGGCNCPLRRQ